MKTKDELFQDEGGKAAFFDVVYRGAKLSKHVSEHYLLQIFDQLPVNYQDTAFRWGLYDSYFVKEAFTYFDENGIQPYVDSTQHTLAAIRKPTMSAVTAAIHSVTYTVLPSGRVTICEIILYHDKGHSVFGHSAVVHKELFDKKLGEQAAYNRAIDKVWDYVAYNIHQGIVPARDFV